MRKWSQVKISAPCRLHIGMLDVQAGSPHQYGGIGITLNEPRTEIIAHQAECFRIDNSDARVADRIRKTAENWCQVRNLSLPNIRIEMRKMAPAHRGLGSGTQLACSVVTLLEFAASEQVIGNTKALNQTGNSSNRKRLAAKELLSSIFQTDSSSRNETLAHRSAESGWRSGDEFSAVQLSVLSNRGERSWVGLESFLSGGWVFDSGVGEHPNRTLSVALRPIPVLLAYPSGSEGCFGKTEQSNFETMNDPASQTDQSSMLKLRDQVLRLVDALGNEATLETSNPYDSTSVDALRLFDTVYHFGRLSGEIFRDFQYDAYATEATSLAVRKIRALGEPGVGQSSWGPGIYCLLRTFEHAANIRNELSSETSFADWIFAESSTSNDGAWIDISWDFD